MEVIKLSPWVELLVTVVCSIFASSGLWAFLQKRKERTDGKTKLLIGLAHDRIMQSAMYYIDRGSITADEYENLYEYLYKPYHELGGNGSAERLMKEIDRLHIASVHVEEGD